MGNILYLDKTNISFLEIMCTDHFCTLRTAACNKKGNGANSDFMLTWKKNKLVLIKTTKSLRATFPHPKEWKIKIYLTALNPVNMNSDMHIKPFKSNKSLFTKPQQYRPTMIRHLLVTKFNMCSGEHFYYCKKGNKTFILYQDVLLRCVGIYWEQFWHICIKYVHKIVCTIHNIR